MKKLLLLYFVLLPMAAFSEDISFTKYIKYTGKVDSNGQPSGKGRIEVLYNQATDLRKDVLEGVFSGYIVSDAKLSLDKHNRPLWINSCSYKGTVEYSIAQDGSFISFKLTDGKFKDSALKTITATPDFPFLIKRTPHDNKCDIEAEPFFANISTPTYHASITDILSPLDISTLGSEKRYSQAEALMLNNEWKLTSIGTIDVVSFPDGLKFMKIASRIGCDYPNGDNITFDTSKKSVVSFLKTYQDAVVEYNGATDKIVIRYSDNREYNGTAEFGQTNFNASEIFKKVMQTEKIADSGISILSGIMKQNGQTTKYTNGKTSEELAKEQQLKEEKAKQDRLASEKELEKSMKEMAASYGITDNEDGKEFMRIYHYAETRGDEGWAVVGYHLCNGIGVKKNVAKGIEFYKKAINSSEVCAQYFGKMFIANQHWTGIGVAKNQKQAALYYAECVDYNSWVYSPYQYYYAEYVALAYCRLGVAFENGILGRKHIDGAIKAYSECVSNGVYDETTAYAIYKLGYYIEKGRYRAVRNIYGTYSPNIRLARSYYHDALSNGDTKTKNLAKKGLQRIGY